MIKMDRDGQKCRSLLVGTPYIDTYSKYGALTSILSPHESTKLWTYFNFLIPLYIRYPDTRVNWFELRECNENTVWISEWDLCPYIQAEQFKTCEIEKNSFTEFVIRQINENKYLYLDITTEPIHEYKEKYRNHDILIYGYNLQKKVLLCSDYFDFRYEKKEIPFNELNVAYEKKRELEMRADYNFIWSYEVAYTRNIDSLPSLYDKLKKILDSNALTLKDPDKDCYVNFYGGLDAYKYLLEDLKHGNIQYSDRRPFAIIKEHVRILNILLQIHGLGEGKYNEKLSIIVDKLLLLSIRCGINRKEAIEIEINRLIEILIVVEKEYIQRVCKSINRLCEQ